MSIRTVEDIRRESDRIAALQAQIDSTPEVLARQAIAEVKAATCPQCRYVGRTANGMCPSCGKVAGVAESHVAPDPLRRPVPPAQPYPLAALGDVLGAAAEAIHRVVQAPDAVCASGVLAAASLAAQAHADVEMDGRFMPLSLWLLSVAESGECKSASDTEAMRAANEYQQELARCHADELVGHAADLAEFEARRESAKANAKKSQGRGLSDAAAVGRKR